jgi:nickel/cobalt transporter (NicO) family protein
LIRWTKIAAIASFSLGLTLARPATAHPAGFTSVNRYVGLQCNADGSIRIAYLLDFAEMPSYSELDDLDADHDGTLTPHEQRAYLERRLPPLVGAWTVLVNGSRATLRVSGSDVAIGQGERGMSTVRIAAEIVAEPVPPMASDVADVHVDVTDPAFADRPGWREMAGDDSAPCALVGGNRERSLDALAYGSGSSPPRVDRAEFTFRRTGAPRPLSPTAGVEHTVLVDPRLASLSAAMKKASGSWTFSAIALALAAFLGAGHALGPGHGKALAAAYLVGRRARISQAVAFGATVTAAHTVVVFLFGLLAVTVERTVGSHRALRGLELASALMVLLLGLTQLSKRWREASSQGHSHSHVPPAPSRDSPYSIVALGASAGLVPCPSGLALLFAAIALHRYAFGLVLVAAFSGGIAAALVTLGVLVILARRVIDRVPVGAAALQWLPVVSSACVTFLGVLLCASAWSTH